MRRPDLGYPQLVFLVLTIVTIVGLILAASTSSVAFGSYNRAWDGGSNIQDVAQSTGTESEIVRNTSQYGSGQPNETLAVVLSPSEGYGPAETDRMRAFVRNGGTLLVAEDFGQHSNSLLSRIGAQARVDERLLRDERYNYRSPAFPVAQNVSNHTLTQGISSLTLNRGTPVRPNGAEVLVSTSTYAYLDTDQNGELDDRDPVGTYPVATSESIGSGRVIVVGDPSMFINAMLDRSGNEAFVRNLFGAHERVLLDYSHAGQLPPLSVVLLIIRETPVFQVLLGTLGLAAIGFWTRHPDIVQQLSERVGQDKDTKPDADPEALASLIRKRHPDWDDERVERVIRGIMTRREKKFN